MGIESDQIVFDYLSRVGDLAQATPLTAAERARLVSALREAIDSRRGGAGVASGGSSRAENAALQKILTGIGTPDEVVRRAVRTGVPAAAEGARTREPAPGGPGRAGALFGKGPSGAGSAAGRASVPTQGGRSRAGGGGDAESGADPDGLGDWWRFGSGGSGGGAGGGQGRPAGEGGSESVYADGDSVEAGTGFGGASPIPGTSVGELPGWRAVYAPEFLHPDQPAPGSAGPDAADPADPAAERVPPQRLADGVDGPGASDLTKGAAPVAAAVPLRRGVLRRVFAPPAPVTEPVVEPVEAVVAPRPPVPLVESLAVLVLVAGAVLSLWYVAVLGWFFAYTARRIGRTAARFAGLWLPLAVAAGCAFWFYSHTHGQPGGHRLTDDQYKAVLRSTIVVWLRSAAACSALFLAWRIAWVRRRQFIL